MKIINENGVPLVAKGAKFCGCCGTSFVTDKHQLDDYNQGVMLLQTDAPMELGEFDTHIVEKLPIPGANIYLKLRTLTEYDTHE